MTDFVPSITVEDCITYSNPVGDCSCSLLSVWQIGHLRSARKPMVSSGISLGPTPLSCVLCRGKGG